MTCKALQLNSPWHTHALCTRRVPMSPCMFSFQETKERVPVVQYKRPLKTLPYLLTTNAKLAPLPPPPPPLWVPLWGAIPRGEVKNSMVPATCISANIKTNLLASNHSPLLLLVSLKA